jgi:glycosyltransferase involved in cell wall biosynthesis
VSAPAPVLDEARPRSGGDRRIRVLFMQSQSFFGSDSKMHSLLMRDYDRDQVEVHVACARGSRTSPSASLRALSTVPDIALRPTSFGPTVHDRSRGGVLASLPAAVPLAGSLGALAWYIRRHGIDVVHGTEKPRDAFYGVLLSRLAGARSVVHLHVGYAGWLSPLVRWAIREADGVVAVSRFVADTAVAAGVPPDKVHVLVNGLDAERWDPEADGGPVRREFGIAPGQPVLAIASRLYHWKGHPLLVRALAEVRREVLDVRLLVIGEDDPRAAPDRGSLTAELRQLASELDLTENVIFTGFRSDVQSLLAACDVYAMPTFEEPCAVAFLEAMAMARPVVALRSGGTPEIVPDGEAGLLSQPNDVPGLAANILRLLRDRELARRMGRAGRRRVETVLTPARMAADGLRIYRRVLER